MYDSLWIDRFWSVIFLSAMILVIGLLSVGCSSTQNRPIIRGSGSPSITMSGSPTGTWNGRPQGGDHEKSNNTPAEPLE